MKSLCFIAIFSLSCIQVSRAELRAKLEILEPFTSTFLTEDLNIFVIVTNTGDRPVSISVGQDSELFFETDPHAPGSTEDQMPRSQSNFPTEKQKGFVLPPGRAYVMSDLDYNEGDMMNPSVFVRVRASLLIEQGRWISSEWHERNIIPTPNLDVESLYDFRISPDSGLRDVIALTLGAETWLFSHPHGIENVGRRLCRVPEGETISYIENNQDAHRLTIHFGAKEEPVVINTRTGMPVSGSEKTVPHLHFWKRIAGRPFTDFYQKMMDRKRGVTTTMDTIGITVPASLEPGATTRPMDTRSHPLNKEESSNPHTCVPLQGSPADHGTVPAWNAWWHWLLGGACLLVVGAIFGLAHSRKSGASV